jgi:hypothetical protein
MQTFRSIRQFATALFVVAAATTAPAFADVIYSNFGAGGAYTAQDVVLLTPGDVTYAESFTPTANFELTDVDLELREFNPDIQGEDGTSLDVLIMSDNGGSPGSILKVLDQPTFIASSTSFGLYQFTSVDFALDLTAGTQYWVALAQPNGEMLWATSVTSDVGYDYTDNIIYPPWNDVPGASGVIEVDGTPLISSVPEPENNVLLEP